MRNNNRRILIIALTTILIFGGISPLLFATAQENKPPQLPKLHIQLVYPEEYLEGKMTFLVEVVNKDSHEAVNYATVYVETANHSDSFPTRTTQGQGVAEWTDVYKFVDYTTIYRVWASKSGYVFDGEYKYYTVTNRALHFVDLPENKQMDEQTSDWVCVKDQYENPIDCWVNFQGLPYWTGFDGCTSIYAFDVTAEDVLEDPWVPVSIDAYKEIPYPYDSAHDLIMVKDLDNVEVTLDCDVDYVLNSDPVWGADVYIILGGEGHSITNQSGKCQFFVFPDTMSGTRYTLLASYPGYWPNVDSAKVQANPGTHWGFDFNLGEIPWWMQDIVEIDLLTLTENTEVGSYTIELGAAPSAGLPGSYTYGWDFGDNEFKNGGEIVSHDFSGTGTYIIKVTATSPREGTEYGELHLTIR